MIRLLIYISLIALLTGSFIPLISVKHARIVRKFSLFAAVIGSIAMLAFSSAILYTGNALRIFLFQVHPLFQIGLFIDRLAAFFMFTIAIVGLAVAVYSLSYIEHYEYKTRKNVLTGLMSIFILSMALVIASANMASLLFFWEIMALSSFILVCLDYDKKETRKAALFYFAMTQLSTLFLVAAFAIIYNITGSLEITQMQSLSSGPQITPLLSTILFLCIFLGFGIKAGIIPFHKWLPYAHPAAPSNISALMSGLMIKVAIYGLIRFIMFVLPVASLWWGVLILVAGTLSAILGVIYALKEHDIKTLLAYHSIENIGIILMGFGLYIIFSLNNLTQLAMLSLASSLFHTLNHALFKSILFMAAGSVVNATGTKNIEELGGLIKKMPTTAVLFLIGAVSISGLPPFNGFVSELMLFQAFFNVYLLGSYSLQMLLVVCVAVLALTSALAAACFVKAFGIIFLAQPRSKKAEDAKEAPSSMLLGPGILAALCILLGVFSFQIFQAVSGMFGIQFSIPNLLVIGILLILTYMLALFFADSGKKSKLKNIRESETWGCGYKFPLKHIPTIPTEYTASGFSEPIVNIFKKFYLPKRNLERNYYDQAQSVFKDGFVEISLIKFFEKYMYMPVAAGVDFVSRKISRLQSAGLDAYVSYLFIACLGIIILMRFII
ncbi:hydrogenase membrane subunit [Candidatus Woesearchaeota archaeon]|nr:hydrogenase membrane subunit [Candidatus Woesearchaeota archaeon]